MTIVEVLTPQEEKFLELTGDDFDVSGSMEEFPEYLALVDLRYTHKYLITIEKAIELFAKPENRDKIKVLTKQTRKTHSSGIFGVEGLHHFVCLHETLLSDIDKETLGKISAPGIAYRGVNFNSKLPSEWKNLVNNRIIKDTPHNSLERL